MTDEVPAALEVRDLRAGYGLMEVVFGVDLHLRAGEVVALVGRNGAGKTTTLRATVGLRDGPFSGSVLVDGRDVTRLGTSRMVEAGVVLVPEGRRIFGSMTVGENLRLGAYSRRKVAAASLEDRQERVFALFPALRAFLRKPCASLSGGEQQMVAVGRAMMAEPRYLLLDEPTAGLAPAVSDEVYVAVRTLAAEGIGLVVVEQSIERALEGSDRTYVMDQGRIDREARSSSLTVEELEVAILGSEQSEQAGPEP